MVRLYVYDERQCDPKRCTARKMRRFRLVEEVPSIRRIPYGVVALIPGAEKAVSREDA